MITTIIITAIVTFGITAFWQHFAEKRKTELYAIAMAGLLRDMNKMAKKMDMANLFQYYIRYHGDDYMRRVKHNIEATFEALGRNDLLDDVFKEYMD